nr:hypothetical protein [Parablautia muri]
MVAHPDIYYKKEAKRKKRDAKKNSLFEILLKRMEKILGYGAGLTSHQIDHGIGKGGSGRPYGKNRETTDNPKGI